MLSSKIVSSPLNFHLEQYDGPLDLLLDLIRKQEINIYDIPIARITQQYLEFMQKATEMNIELSAEFVYMAATLILIKSKTLLPQDPELAKLEQDEDPRTELDNRVLERAKSRPVYEIGKVDVSVPDMIRYLHKVFGDQSGSVSARDLFERQRS